VLSGINRGANAGRAVLHSGTVGAVATAGNRDCYGMAVSLDVLSPTAGTAASGGAAIAALDTVDDEARNWPTAARIAADLLPALCRTPPGTVFNLNVPDVHRDRLRGLRRGALAGFGQVNMILVEAGEGYVRTAVEASEARPEPGTDLGLLADGYACVTPLYVIREAVDVEVDLPATVP
jgi:5'-nucleotidase